MNLLVRALLSWIPIGVAVTGLSLLSYTLVQQNYRQTLNDPQVQMAEDAAVSLDKEYTPAAVVPRANVVDLRESLAPWIAVYDSAGKPLESSGVFDGAPPQPPQGIFDDLASGKVHGAGSKRYFKEQQMAATGENRLSWQPMPDVRQAIVVVQLADNKGFVVAGRNMREVEGRISQAGTFTLLAWLTILAASLCGSIFNKYVKSEMRKRDGNV